MSARTLTMWLGVLYLLIGVLGFVPGITRATAVPGHGLLLGIFAVNTIHNLAHLILGAVLVWAARGPSLVKGSQILAVVFAVLVVASFILPLREGIAINLPDTILHLVSMLITGYVGFTAAGRGTAMA
ncbi:MAG TPA: DUF4383 domain-containing protein [bacterium]|nr:DUF4383 domain-containing protein [bacterium]